MIAAAVVLAGIAANAAVINWKVDYIDGIDEAPMTGYYGYLIVDSVSGAGAASYAGPSYGADLALAAIQAGDASFVNTYALADVNGNIATAFGENTAMSAALGYDKTAHTEQFDVNTDVKAYLVILDDADPTKATTAFVLDQAYTSGGVASDATTSINGSGGSDKINFGNAWYATEDPNGWYTVNAPEPTSGLLLLLGVGALALRRRRA